MADDSQEPIKHFYQNLKMFNFIKQQVFELDSRKL